jgi:DNA-binding NarL/FixJ family response regulator
MKLLMKTEGAVPKTQASPGSLTALLAQGDVAVAPLLPTLFASSVMGVALLDSQIRFQAVNGALAAMNGFPAAAHIGKKLRYILGSSTSKIETVIRQVLETGAPVSNMELKAKLPGRLEKGHWIESFLAVRDEHNRVTQVAALVVELTEQEKLQAALQQVLRNLKRVSTVLKSQLQCFEIDYSALGGVVGSLPKAVDLIDLAIAQTRTIAEVTPQYLPTDVPLLRNGFVENAEMTASDNSQLEMLSKRELQVFRLLADCKSNKDVAGEMKITVRTAETYRARVMIKLQLRSIGHLVRFAVRNRIIRP